jgi:hypothetical protein
VTRTNGLCPFAKPFCCVNCKSSTSAITYSTILVRANWLRQFVNINTPFSYSTYRFLPLPYDPPVEAPEGIS